MLSSSLRRAINIWWSSARPKTLPAAMAPVIIGAAMAYADGHWSLPVFMATFMAAVFIQIGTNYANDYFDFIKGTDTEDRVGPTRATAAGLVTPRQMLVATVVVFGIATLLGLYLVIVGGWPILVIGVLSIACGVLYTAGPCPLGYRGWADLFVLLFFGLVATAGTYYVLRGKVTALAILAGLGPGLISTAVLTVNNVRDYHTDRDTGKRTLVVRWGLGFGRAEYAATLIGACLVPVLLVVLAQGHYAALLALASLSGAVPLVRRMYAQPNPEQMNQLLALTGKLLIGYSVLFAIGWLL